MTETIQQLKEDIAILQEKLRKLEEHQMTLENEGEFDMVSYNNEIYFRMEFPTGANWWKRDFRTDTMMLVDSQPLEQYYQDQVVAEREREMIKRNLKTSLQELANGDVRPIDDVMKEVEKLQEKDWDIKVETDYLTGKARHKWNIVDKDGNDYKPEPITTEELLKPNWEPKPQEPEEVAEGLRSAFGKAQQTEEWKETQRKIDEQDSDKNFKNSLDLIREWGEKNKPKTLHQICMEWWDEVFVNEMDDDICIDVLVSKIDNEFIPPSSDRNGYEWEKCLKMMRDKLR